MVYFAALAAIVFAGTASAFVVDTDESGIYVIKYHASQVRMEIKLPATASLGDGHSQRSSVAAAMEAWNVHLGTMQFQASLSSPSTYSTSNGVNEIVMDSAVDGEAFPVGGALAVTVRYSNGNDAAETDIVFNTFYGWDSYRGPLQGRQDIQRVAIHELGHALGLDHPDENRQSVTAIMNSHVSNLDRLQADDIAGAQTLYGAPGVSHANDQFSNATAIDIPASYAFQDGPSYGYSSGSNIGATREAGEPDHATSTTTRTVWWKWTAKVGGSMAITTLGSDFDTVLAVYTGGSVGGLTTITANDDEEPFTEESTPQRKRTSTVTFRASSGTTYYFAVGGWGDADPGGLLSGYTGAIKLNLTFTQLEPLFTKQPESRTITYPFSLTLQAIASGPSIHYQWQRNGIAVSEGPRETALNIGGLQPRETGIYDVVASTGDVSVRSTPAIVGLTSTAKVAGSAHELGSNILHPNGNTFDQMLLDGPEALFTADAPLNQITRLSFVDLSDDIVQLEFSGPGTVSLALDAASGPSAPINYHQPGVDYVKGHVGIVVAGARENTHLSVFSVGKANAVNQSLFRDGVAYDGVADIAYIAVLSSDGKFGGLRAANANFWATRGHTGVYAPGVQFTGPVYIGDVNAQESAQPVIIVSSATAVQINGGNLEQMNGRPVKVSGMQRLQFVDNMDSHGRAQPAQPNRARLETDGVDVTSSIVVAPAP